MKKGIDYTGLGVCVFCHDGKGNYLVGQRSEKCKDEHFAWHPIGSGSVEPGEMLEDAVRREVKEECNAEVKEINFIGFRESVRQQGSEAVHWVHFDYLVLVDPKEIKNMEPELCLELQWCTPDSIPKPWHSKFSEFLEKYKDVL